MIEEIVTKFSSKLVYKYRYDFVPTPECQVWPSFVAPGMAGGKKTKRAGASFSGNLAEACISCRASSTMKASWGIHHVVNDVDVVGTDSSLVVQEIIQ